MSRIPSNRYTPNWARHGRNWFPESVFRMQICKISYLSNLVISLISKVKVKSNQPNNLSVPPNRTYHSDRTKFAWTHRQWRDDTHLNSARDSKWEALPSPWKPWCCSPRSSPPSTLWNLSPGPMTTSLPRSCFRTVSDWALLPASSSVCGPRALSSLVVSATWSSALLPENENNSPKIVFLDRSCAVLSLR